jgi:predicted AAA+ superfamily ATPase
MEEKIPLDSAQAVVLMGVRRSGKSTLQAQLRNRIASGFYCNFEDPRLSDLEVSDFAVFLELVDELAPGPQAVFFDEVQELAEWQRLVRLLLDRGRPACLTGSNASLLGRELGVKLTGRHLSFEVFPFSYSEYLSYTGEKPGRGSLLTYLSEGGFAGYLRERRPEILRELFRDIIQRDIAHRHKLRETRHLMNLGLYLLANTGQPFSLHRLSKALEVPSVGQTSHYVGYLEDAYLILSLPRFSASFKQRVISPKKYYAIDNGLRRMNSQQTQPDVGHRLENAVFLALRRENRSCHYAAESGLWECDFVTDTHAIQVCSELTPVNLRRELAGLVGAAKLPGERACQILTLDQGETLDEDGLRVEVLPAWEWLARR